MKYFWLPLAMLVIVSSATGLIISQGLAQQPADLSRQPSEQRDEPAVADEQPETSVAEEPVEEEKDVVRIEWADQLRWDSREKTAHLSGNVVFAHEDVKLYCDEAWYNDEEETARAVGHLKIVDPDTTIVGDLITADFDEEKMVITGNVRMVTQKKKKRSSEESKPEEEQPARAVESSESAEATTASEEESGEEEEPEKLKDYWEKKTTITCQKIVYYYADDVKKALIYGPLKAIQEDKTAWADEAVYEDLEDKITLTGNVRIVTDEGDELRCPKAVIAIEEDWIRAENITGFWLRRKKEEKKEEPTTAPAAESPALRTE